MSCSANQRHTVHMRWHRYSSGHGIFSSPIAPCSTFRVRTYKTSHQTQKLRRLTLTTLPQPASAYSEAVHYPAENELAT